MGINLKKAAGAVATGGLSLASGLFGDDSGAAPRVDPQVRANAEKMSKIGNDSYAWNAAEAQKLQPLYANLTSQAGGVTSNAVGRAGGIGAQYDNTFAPVNEQVASDAMTYDSAAEIERAAGQAASDTATAFGRAKGREGAYMARYGLNPANFASQNYTMNLEQAKAETAAANNARESRRMGGIQLRSAAAGLGNQVLAGANATSGVALGGAGVTGTLATGGIDAYNRGTSAALPWITGSNSALLGVNAAESAAYQADRQAEAAKWAGIGQLVGTAGGFALGGPAGAMAGGQAGRGLGSAATANYSGGM